MRIVVTLVLALIPFNFLRAATPVELEILGDISKIEGIKWPLHEGALTGHTWEMKGDWVFNIRLPGGESVRLPTKQMYQLQQNMGVLTDVKLYPVAGSAPFDDLLGSLPSVIEGAGFTVTDEATGQIAKWKAVPADKRQSIGYESIALSPDKDVEVKLVLGTSGLGKTLHYHWVVNATRNAARAVYKKLAYSRFRQPSVTVLRKAQWNRPVFSRDGKQLLVVESVSGMAAINVDDGSVAYDVKLRAAGDENYLSDPGFVVLSADGKELAVGYGKGGILIINTADGSLNRTVGGDIAGGANAISADFSRAVFVIDKKIHVVSLKDSAVLQQIAPPKRGVESIALSANGEVIGITEEFAGHGFYYRVGEAAPFQTLKPTGFSSPYVFGHHILKDNKRVLGFGVMARNLSVWSLETGKLLRPIATRGQNRAVLSSDEKLAAASTWSAQDYESITVHEVDTGKKLDELAGYERPVIDMCFSPDGSKVAATLKGGTILIWGFWPKPSKICTSAWGVIYQG